MVSNKTKALLLQLLAIVCWSVSPIIMRFIKDHFTVYFQILVRNLASLVLLWPAVLLFLGRICAPEVLKVVLNRSHKRDRITSKDIEKTLGHPVFWSLPNDYNTAIESINSGQPLVSFNSTGLARSYMDLAKKLAGAPVETQKRKLMGLFN